MTVHPLARAFASLLLTLGLVGCGGEEGPTQPEITSVNVASPERVVEPGGTLQLTATVRSSSGAAFGNGDLTWTSSDPDAATVSETGLVVGKKTGSVTISATLEDRTGTVELVVAKIYRGSLVTDTAGSDGVVGVSTLSLEGADFRFTLHTSDGSPAEGAILEYFETDNFESVVLLHRDSDRFAPSMLYGYPVSIDDYLVERADPESDVAASPQRATQGQSARTVFYELEAVPLAEAAEPFDPDVIRSTYLFWNLLGRALCGTYGEAGDIPFGEGGPSSRARLIAAVNASETARDDLSISTGGALLRRPIPNVDSEAVGDLLSQLAKASGLGSDDDPAARLLARYAVLDAEVVEPGLSFVAIQVIPDDPYCAGEVPAYAYAYPGVNVWALPGSEIRAGVQFLNIDEQPVEGVPAVFTIARGQGSIPEDTVFSDADGIAAVSWTLPDQLGTWKLDYRHPFYSGDGLVVELPSSVEVTTYQPPEGTAVIDGVLSPGEWEGALKTTVLSGSPPAPASGLIMNDGVHVYIAVEWPYEIDVGTWGNPTFFALESEDGDNLFASPSPVPDNQAWRGRFDAYRTAGAGVDYDEELGDEGTEDGTWAFQSSPGGPTVVEVAHPLDSGDPFDWSLAGGDRLDIEGRLVWGVAPNRFIFTVRFSDVGVTIAESDLVPEGDGEIVVVTQGPAGGVPGQPGTWPITIDGQAVASLNTLERTSIGSFPPGVYEIGVADDFPCTVLSPNPRTVRVLPNGRVGLRFRSDFPCDP